jgi:hypothetical protein
MSTNHLGRLALITLLLMFFGNASVLAQGRGNSRMMDKDGYVAQELTAINEAVGLSEEQSTAISALLGTQFDARRDMMTALRESGGDMGAMRDKMTELSTKTDELITAQLTEAQVPKFAEFRQKQQAERGQRRRGGPGGRPGPQ